MHEIGIVKNILALVLKEAAEAGAVRVKKIELVIGGMTGVLEDCVSYYLEIMGKGTVAEGADVSVTMVQPLALCRNCRITSAFKPGIEWRCPHCNGTSLQIVGGRELIVKSIDVEMSHLHTLTGETQDVA